MTKAHDPAAEAQQLLGDGRRAHVLEPSPPAVGPPTFSDDPAVPAPGPGRTVTPTSAGDVTWDELARTDGTIAAFARGRWLGAWAPLQPAPPDLARTREELHRVAYSVVAEARRLVNGKFGLRYTRGGFGTPFFAADRQVRVEGDVLVVQDGDVARAEPLTTVGAAAALVDIEPGTTAAEHDSPGLGDTARPLDVDPDAARFLGEWFGFAASVLEELRLSEGAHDVTQVQLWPGHFDPAVEMGDAEGGRRATYGASPGDPSHAEPYLYVGPWGAVDADDELFWNAEDFPGAQLTYRDLLAAPDAREAALGFFRHGHSLLDG